MITFVGPAKRIEDMDLPRIGREIGVGEDEIHAVMDVEAAGSGFDNAKRPKMLFEPHVFYRNLSGARLLAAGRAGLAYKSWGEKPYPADSYPRLEQAMKIDETAALRSASWGLGQILGENHIAAGYPTPQSMVADFTLDEDNHLEAMIRFIKANNLDDNIRDHDWAGFARGYNGPQYAKHNYHGRLASAYARWAKIPDTPYVPEAVETEQVVRGIEWVQRALNTLGATPTLVVDGLYGPATRAMLERFQREYDLDVTGLPDERTVVELDLHLKRLDATTTAIPPPTEPPSSGIRAFLRRIFG